jgi:hypothetical protein
MRQVGFLLHFYVLLGLTTFSGVCTSYNNKAALSTVAIAGIVIGIGANLWGFWCSVLKPGPSVIIIYCRDNFRHCSISTHQAVPENICSKRAS